MLCAIYLRLSKEDDVHEREIKNRDESESIANQRAMLVDYATTQGWEIYRIYSDDDYSGVDNNEV